jgi:triphosphoribosyl-dephospho-CoA synthase
MMRPAERAQLAMMLEVTAYPKPGNVDRCHDYPETHLEHFLASMIFARQALEEAGEGKGRIGEIIGHAVRDTNRHSGGNTHFGAFILLIPLLYGKDIPGAIAATGKTDTSDAIAFYKAFAMTSVKMNETDELDVNDPHTLTIIRDQEMTLLDIMQHSAAHDMVARQWVTGFPLVRRGADLLKETGPGRQSIVTMFLTLLATEPDTFIIKKHGIDVARETMLRARDVLDGKLSVQQMDEDCIQRDINPGSIADITIASIFIALGEGWSWDS